MDDASNQTFGLDGDGVTAVTLSAQRAMVSRKHVKLTELNYLLISK